MSEKGGAGLGFITIGMKSGNKLKVDFKKINDQFSLFTLTSSVNLIEGNAGKYAVKKLA